MWKKNKNINKLNHLLVIIVLTFIQSCKSYTTDEFNVHFQAGFHDDFISLILSGDTIYSGKLNTDEVLGYAKAVKFETNQKLITVLYKNQKINYKLNPNENYVGIWIDDDKLKIYSKRTPFRYE